MPASSLFAPVLPASTLAPWAGRSVLVTGGLGFIGSGLAQALAQAGARVRILDALLPLYGGNWRNLEGVQERVSTFVADVRDADAVNAAVADCDVVFHVAAQTSHLDSMTEPLLDADINVRGMLTLLEALRHHAPRARLVNVGTRAQYGAVVAGRVDESGPFAPTDVYGVSKHAAEQYAIVYHRAFGLDVRGVRATNTFGPRHQMKHGRYGILNWFVRLALDGRDVTIYGKGAQLRDYLYVDDLIDALLRVGALPDGAGRIYNVSSGTGIPFREMAERVVALAGSGRLVTLPWPADRERIETGDLICDATLLQRDTGWAPRTVFAEGLARTIEFYRAHRDDYWTLD